jgi:hypothetical protein
MSTPGVPNHVGVLFGVLSLGNWPLLNRVPGGNI